MSAGAIGDAEFATLMAPLGPWPDDRRVAVAVSGGADSLALAALVARWARRSGGVPVALIVDHGLRSGSGDESLEAAERLRALGLEARLLTLSGLEPGAALQERARRARFACLARACRQAGLVDLLLGHHRDDQDETRSMRMANGSGPIGAAGMAMVSERDGCRLVRPLLDVPKARLRATLVAAGIGWAEDPSNSDPRFRRARLRAGTDEGARSGGGGSSVGPAAEGRARVEDEAVGWLARHVTVFEAGHALLPEGAWPPDALAFLLRTLSGSEHPPRREAVRRLAERPRGATLHGVRLVPSPARIGAGWLAFREGAAVADPVEAVPEALWDGRFRLRSAGGSAGFGGCPARPGWTLGALGRAAAIRLRGDAARRWPIEPMASLPALRAEDGTLLSVPHLGWRDASTAPVSDEFSVIFSPTVPLGANFFTSARHRWGSGENCVGLASRRCTLVDTTPGAIMKFFAG